MEETPSAKATFGAGCFWGVEAAFRRLAGVKSTQVGYIGGKLDHPTYEQVCTGTTGHAESVEVTFDPARISFGEILQVFFAVAHNPTELNRQGPDVGAQYRSELFYVDDAQRQIAQAYIAQLDRSHAFARPIVTRVEPLKGIYAAEDYHQDFLVHNPHSPYIVFNDLPKIENLRRELPSFYLTEPVLVAPSDGVNRP